MSKKNVKPDKSEKTNKSERMDKSGKSKNYYDVLGVNPNCTDEEINISYRKLAIKWHPDKNKNNKEEAESRFREISEAYQILSNKDSRKNYDSHGVTTIGGNGHLIDPYEIFKGIFDTEDNEIPNVIVKLEADIDRLYKGFTTTVSFTRYSPCKKCDSTGTRDGKSADCRVCQGRGILMETAKGGKVGFVLMEKKCDTCEGKGIDPDVKLCKKCEGAKYIKEELECEVDVPAGAYDKYFIKLEDEGNFIPKEDRKSEKTRTDVIVIVKEDIPPEIPIRRGMFIQELNRVNRADLLMTVDVTFAESLFGIKKEVRFLASQSLGIEIDDVIQNGDIHVIKNMGMPLVPEELQKNNDDTKRGDLFLMFKVEKPNLTKQQRKRLWQIITDTSYPESDDIDNIHQTVSFTDYINEQKKKIKPSKVTSDGSEDSVNSDKSKDDSSAKKTNKTSRDKKKDSSGDSEIEDHNDEKSKSSSSDDHSDINSDNISDNISDGQSESHDSIDQEIENVVNDRSSKSKRR